MILAGDLELPWVLCEITLTIGLLLVCKSQSEDVVLTANL